jgi:tungstate transport system permease protein
MDDGFGSAFSSALQLISGGDPALLRVVALSLQVSLMASAAAALLGLPFGAALAVLRFPGRRGLVLLMNALLGLPPVVVGLALYLLLSRAGLLGGLDLLFTPGAMVLAQALLALPIVAALAHRAAEAAWAIYGDELQMDGAGRLRAIPVLLRTAPAQVLTAVLAGFGRSVSEVGAILIVGGNIAGQTRTMTTAVALETSRGNLAFALALGVVLVTLSLAVNLLAFVTAGLAAGRVR